MRLPRSATPAFLLSLLLVLLAGCATMEAASAWLNDRFAIAPPQLQRHLDHRFPRSFDKLGGLVTVTLDNPQVSIPTGDSRLRLDFDVGLGALGGQGATTGHFALASGLRYEPATQGLHLDSPELLQFELPGSGDLLRGSSRAIVNSLLAEIARSEPVYRLDDGLLSKLPLGKRIGTVGIEHGAVIVHLDR